MNMTPTTVLNHPTLGPIRGRRFKENNTTQFRGLKYASIPGRWQDPVLLEKHSQNGRPGEIDGCKFGPACPQHPGGLKFDFTLVGDVKLEKLGETSEGVDDVDELECCNLIVTLPDSCEKIEEGSLPVFVWVHGGGFTVGSNSWPQYDLTKFVETSVKIGKPVIGVSINYRLGFFGFLASEELGARGNYGLKDQACAFKWIQKYISGFGGNPSMITAAGESAGSILIHHLFLCKERLFDRAILMSGDIMLRRPRSKKWQEAHARANTKLLGLDSLTASERKEAVLKLSADQITEKLPMFQHFSPTIDGDFIEHAIDFSMLIDPESPIGKPSWCKEIVIGSTHDDGTIFKTRVLDNPNIMPLLHKTMTSLLTPAQQNKIMEKYLPEPLTPEKQYTGLLNMMSDLRFYLATDKVGEGYTSTTNCQRKAYRYQFVQPNPFTGYYTGLASHELDVAYLLQNFNSQMPNKSDDHKFSEEMAVPFANFTYGKGLGLVGEEKQDDFLILGHQGTGDGVSILGQEEFQERIMNGRGNLMDELGWELCFELGERLQGVAGDNPYGDVEGGNL